MAGIGNSARPDFARWLSGTNEITRGFLAAGRIPGLINMAGGLPPVETYPAESLSRIAAEVVADNPAEALGYGPIEGLPALRATLAARLSKGALRLTEGNILVTSGGLSALDLIGKVLVDPGQTIAAQFPTYLGALDAWRPRAPAFRPFAPDAADFAPAFAGAQFAYAVPNYSNPTGHLVGLEARRAMVAAARACGTWLVEDDPYGSLHYDTPPLPRLIDLDAAGQGEGPYDGPVLYLGTVSKELAPGLRLGWVAAAPAMIEALTVAKQGSDLCTNGVTQLMAVEAFREGLPERIGPRARALYAARRDALVAAMTAHLADRFHWTVPSGGMFLWATARNPALDTDRLLSHAIAQGVTVTPSSVFDPSGTLKAAIRINFTLNPPDLLAEGVRRLARAVAALEAETAPG